MAPSTADAASSGRTSPRRGVWVFPSAPAPALVDAIVAAEALGVDEFWIGDEGPARDPFAVLAAAARLTSRIRLGIAVTNPYLRHPMTTAIEAMTIDELSNGRMLLGLGPGGHVALGPAGVERSRPLAAVREALRLIRAVSRGESTEGYDPPPGAFTRPGLQVHIGSRSRRFQELASREADGVFLGGIPRSALGQTIAWAHSVRTIPLGVYSTGVFGEADAEALRPRMIMPLADSPDHTLDALGLERVAVRAAAEALLEGDATAAQRLMTDEIFDDLIISGTPDRIGGELAARVERFAPSTIGLTFTTADPLRVVEHSASAFEVMNRRLHR
ncbi:LLM class flavin-dependent oxidoreductase [Ruicaihuangia caeni]|uniref:LLM class flavin-dependent oxidoreductase n=1 Tax=Ruicaihuangia caeni TaxID=3042517 RepID=UPI00338DC020